MEIDHHFLADYSLITAAELPPSGQRVVHFKFGATQAPPHGLDGPLVQIEPKNGSSWFAVFGGGYSGAGVVDEIFTTPRPTIVCVISKGAGFLVDTVNESKQDVPVFPVRQVEVRNDLLIFADFTRLAAYGAGGIAWVSEDLVSDKLIIGESRAHTAVLACRGLDVATQHDIEVEVDILTGRVIAKNRH